MNAKLNIQCLLQWVADTKHRNGGVMPGGKKPDAYRQAMLDRKDLVKNISVRDMYNQSDLDTGLIINS